MLLSKQQTKQAIEWIATGISITSAFILAAGYKEAFISYAISALMFLYIFVGEKRTSQIIINGFFLCANVFGCYNAFLK